MFTIIYSSSSQICNKNDVYSYFLNLGDTLKTVFKIPQHWDDNIFSLNTGRYACWNVLLIHSHNLELQRFKSKDKSSKRFSELVYRTTYALRVHVNT